MIKWFYENKYLNQDYVNTAIRYADIQGRIDIVQWLQLQETRKQKCVIL